MGWVHKTSCLCGFLPCSRICYLPVAQGNKAKQNCLPALLARFLPLFYSGCAHHLLKEEGEQLEAGAWCCWARKAVEQQESHPCPPELHPAAQTASKFNDAPHCSAHWSCRCQCMPARVGQLPCLLPSPLLVSEVQLSAPSQNETAACR